MTQIFQEDGKVTPVTVIEAGPCVVVQIKTADKDVYEAVQVGLVDPKAARLANKPQRTMLLWNLWWGRTSRPS